MKKYKVAIVGASGIVGKMFSRVLSERNLPIEQLYLFASARSAGTAVDGRVIEELTPAAFDRGIDIALFAVEGPISKTYAPIAAQKGCVVIDNSSAWRMDPAVPLVVPEVNPADLAWHKGIIANPNCSTVQAVVALNPLHKAYNIRRIVYTTFQSVSGAGINGWNDLERTLKGEAPSHFPYPIAGNCLPHIDTFGDDGYTGEENKMINETRKIMHAPEIKITATTVRVPVFTGHSESINVTFEKPFELDELKQILAKAPGIVLQDDPQNTVYPTPLAAAGKDEVFVGRVRRDMSVESGVNLWVVADNLRKGAATNAVQIAEMVMRGC